MENIHCIHHANCTDGFTSAWVVSKKFPKVTLHAANYGDLPPVLPKDATVFIVDFSYPLDILLALAEQVESVLVLDHHASAIRRLQDQATETLPDNLELVLDTSRSGARLAWDYFFEEESVPDLVKFVEDRDLWKFTYGDLTRWYVRTVMAQPFELKAYEAVHRQDQQKTIDEGALLIASDNRHIEWHLENALRMVHFGGHLVPLVNAPKYLVSEITNILVKSHPLALAYHDTDGGRLFRITTSKDYGIDASKLAEQFGGGGHENAAGFFVGREHDMAKL